MTNPLGVDMKHRTAIVMAGSIVGVMLAGSAVLAANFGILSGADDLGALDPQTPPISTNVVTPTTTVSSTVPSDLVAYQVEGLGVVTLLRQGDTLDVDSVTVDPAWVWEIDDDSDHLGGVKIEFGNGEREVEFRAWVENGEVVVSVDEENVVIDGSDSDDDSDEIEDEDDSDDVEDHDESEDEDDDSHEEDD
jgi:hypothetical protein